MKVKVDLTKEDFADNDKVNFYDSKTIFFEPTNKLPETVNFKIWGADIDVNFDWSNYVDIEEYPNLKKAFFKEKGAITVKGFSELTFKNVVAGKIKITPYDKGTFVKQSNGEQLTYKREWSLDKIDADVTEYWLDTSIYFPYGACDLKLYAKGKVTFEFDPGDCIHYLDYITDKRRDKTFWGYLRSKELTTNSYRYKDLDPEK
jgi:hypothetical protein